MIFTNCRHVHNPKINTASKTKINTYSNAIQRQQNKIRQKIKYNHGNWRAKTSIFHWCKGQDQKDKINSLPFLLEKQYFERLFQSWRLWSYIYDPITARHTPGCASLADINLKVNAIHNLSRLKTSTLKMCLVFCNYFHEGKRKEKNAHKIWELTLIQDFQKVNRNE